MKKCKTCGYYEIRHPVKKHKYPNEFICENFQAEDEPKIDYNSLNKAKQKKGCGYVYKNLNGDNLLHCGLDGFICLECNSNSSDVNPKGPLSGEPSEDNSSLLREPSGVQSLHDPLKYDKPIQEMMIKEDAKTLFDKIKKSNFGDGRCLVPYFYAKDVRDKLKDFNEELKKSCVSIRSKSDRKSMRTRINKLNKKHFGKQLIEVEGRKRK